MMDTVPQVVLFGSMQGEWREKSVIPVLNELGVTFYNPNEPGKNWNPDKGREEAEMMAACETIVIVINGKTAGITALMETGWAALGAQQRNQTLIMTVLPEEYVTTVPFYLKIFPKVREMQHFLNHYAQATRNLVRGHVKEFNLPNLIVTDSVEGVNNALRKRYGK
ncbi:MAG: hypothetical protein K8L91_02740 [Anaerolineae bacterium]|nr:hypothetical protein [Anaerolineae bacterium]